MTAPLVDATPPTTNPDSEPPRNPANDLATIPEWAAKEIVDTRREAAKWRTQLRALEDKFKDAKTAEEFNAAMKELQDAKANLELDLLKAKVGKDLPDELAALLQGTTEAELKKHAEVLARFAPKGGDRTPDNLGGGLDPSLSPDGDFDPVAIARKARAGLL